MHYVEPEPAVARLRIHPEAAVGLTALRRIADQLGRQQSGLPSTALAITSTSTPFSPPASNASVQAIRLNANATNRTRRPPYPAATVPRADQDFSRAAWKATWSEMKLAMKK